MKLSIQACQALMMVLQHGLMEQISVVDILRDLEFVEDGDGQRHGHGQGQGNGQSHG